MLAALLVGCSVSREARACAACACGDPTLVAAGTEQPFAGRVRASLEARYRTDSIGEPDVDAMSIEELRSDLGVAWAPSDRSLLLAGLPLVHKSVTAADLSTERTWGVGDAELRAKFYVFRDRPLRPRWLVAGLAGVKLPTAPLHDGPDGRPLPLEAQAGTGSWDILLGGSLAFGRDWFSLYASVQASLPFVTSDELEPSAALRATLAPQAQVFEALALRSILEARLDGAAEEQGRSDPNSGGFVLYAGLDVLVQPALDLTLSAGARLPAYQALRGFHDEGPVLTAAVAYDF